MMSIYKGRLKNEYSDFSDDLLRLKPNEINI